MAKGDTAKAGAGGNWIWTLVRGIFALALGVFLLVGTSSAPIAIAYVLAIYMAISGAVQTFVGFTGRNAAGARTDRIRGLVGLIGGVALLLLAYFNVLTLASAYTILAVLLILYGLLGLWEAILDRGASRFRWMPILVNALLVVLGVLVFLSRSQNFDLRIWSGIVLSIIGIGVIAYASYMRRSRRNNQPVTV